GNVAVDDDKATSVEGVFAAGDMSRGQSLIVWGIQEGRAPARGGDRFLMGDSLLPPGLLRPRKGFPHPGPLPQGGKGERSRPLSRWREGEKDPVPSAASGKGRKIRSPLPLAGKGERSGPLCRKREREKDPVPSPACGRGLG